MGEASDWGEPAKLDYTKLERRHIVGFDPEVWPRQRQLRYNYGLILIPGMSKKEIRNGVIRGIEEAHSELGFEEEPRISVLPQNNLEHRVARKLYDENMSDNFLDMSAMMGELINRLQRHIEKRIVLISPASSQMTGQTIEGGVFPIIVSYENVCRKYGEKSLSTVVKHEVGHATLSWQHHNDDLRDSEAWKAGKIDANCILASATSVKGKKYFCDLCRARGKLIDRNYCGS